MLWNDTVTQASRGHKLRAQCSSYWINSRPQALISKHGHIIAGSAPGPWHYRRPSVFWRQSASFFIASPLAAGAFCPVRRRSRREIKRMRNGAAHSTTLCKAFAAKALPKKARSQAVSSGLWSWQQPRRGPLETVQAQEGPVCLPLDIEVSAGSLVRSMEALFYHLTAGALNARQRPRYFAGLCKRAGRQSRLEVRP